eukprot:452681-Hanusia_phi.AAC.1
MHIEIPGVAPGHRLPVLLSMRRRAARAQMPAYRRGCQLMRGLRPLSERLSLPLNHVDGHRESELS